MVLRLTEAANRYYQYLADSNKSLPARQAVILQHIFAFDAYFVKRIAEDGGKKSENRNQKTEGEGKSFSIFDLRFMIYDLQLGGWDTFIRGKKYG